MLSHRKIVAVSVSFTVSVRKQRPEKRTERPTSIQTFRFPCAAPFGFLIVNRLLAVNSFASFSKSFA